jgi:hypothetical protein
VLGERCSPSIPANFQDEFKEEFNSTDYFKQFVEATCSEYNIKDFIEEYSSFKEFIYYCVYDKVLDLFEDEEYKLTRQAISMLWEMLKQAFSRLTYGPIQEIHVKGIGTGSVCSYGPGYSYCFIDNDTDFWDWVFGKVTASKIVIVAPPKHSKHKKVINFTKGEPDQPFYIELLRKIYEIPPEQMIRVTPFLNHHKNIDYIITWQDHEKHT